MTNRALVLVVLCLTLAVSAALVSAQPPPGGGGPGGNRGQMQARMYFEMTWAAVCFKLQCTPDQVIALQPTYAAALDARDKDVAAARAANDRPGMQKAFETCKATLDAKLKEILSAQQQLDLEKLMAPPPPRPQGQ